MEKIAVSIVLLPPIGVMHSIIRLSRGLGDAARDNLPLSLDDFLPHITLRMGVLAVKDIPRAKEVLDEVARRHIPVNIDVVGARTIDKGGNDRSAWLDIIRTDSLYLLHKDVVESFSREGLLSFAGVGEMFFGDIDKVPVFWHKGLHEFAVLEKYEPHVTLGYGIAPEVKSFDFDATRLALCHLGTHCSCRKVLCEKTLQR